MLLCALACLGRVAGFEDCLRSTLEKNDADLSRADLVACSGSQAASDDVDTCELTCTLKALGVYWACALECVVQEGPDACILDKCPAVVVAYDVPCLSACTNATVA